jgi:hypothetical protein
MTNGRFPQSPTWPGKCAIATSISRCLSRRASKSMSRWRSTSPTWLPIPMPRTATRESAPCRMSAAAGGLLSGRFAAADPAMRKLMLEALTWRYYRIPKS